MTSVVPGLTGQAAPDPQQGFDTLRAIERRVLWLSIAMIDHASNARPNPSGMKVGGHQASSASMSSIMTALWFGHLQAEDRVLVKPHASPVLRAVKYLLGELDESYLTKLREFGGLQSYPSRAKDPDGVDYSTGLVGIGATAPIWGALARRYVDSHFGSGGTGRQYALLGDAELDEGACWEAISEPMVAELGEVVWIVDLNRQSLDRVVPNLRAQRLEGMFAAAGWQTITLKYGHDLQALFARSGGEVLQRRLDEMSNPEYQRLLRCPAQQVHERLPGDGPDARSITRLTADLTDQDLLQAIRNLGGHDLQALDEAFGAGRDGPVAVAGFIVSQREAHGVPHAVSCLALGVSRSWFYKWKDGTLPPRAARRQRLKAETARLFRQRGGKEGSPRVTAALREAGWRVSETPSRA